MILIGRDRRLAGRLFAMAAAGAAGVAALNVTRLVVVWQRSGGSFETLTGLWGSMRVSAVFGDPNAAGSYLGLALLLVAGLALGGRLWLPVLPIVAAALWLTGSRAALVSTVLGAVVLLPTAMRASRRLMWGTAAVVVLVLAASLPFAAGRLTPDRDSARAVSQSFNFRVGMTRAAGRMIAEHPAFGVGVGMFLPRSSAYIGDGLRETVPRENAHNNFLQVLAELGLAGFVPFLAILALPAWRVARAVRDGNPPAAGVGAAAGLLAFVLSWLSGHPLLVFEVSASFWLLLGALAGQFSPHDGSAASARLARRARVLGWATAVFAACIVVSVPFRGWAAEPRLGFDRHRDWRLGLGGGERGALQDSRRPPRADLRAGRRDLVEAADSPVRLRRGGRLDGRGSASRRGAALPGARGGARVARCRVHAAANRRPPAVPPGTGGRRGRVGVRARVRRQGSVGCAGLHAAGCRPGAVSRGAARRFPGHFQSAGRSLKILAAIRS